jgi:deoxyribonuclease-4
MTTNKANNSEYRLIIGRHVPVKSPRFLLGAVEETVSYEANALAIFVGSPQKSERQSVNRLKISEFKNALKKSKIDINNVVVHGPYIFNLANALNKENFQWSVKFLKKELTRMAEIGLKTIVLHPGSAVKTPTEKALDQVAYGINLILAETSGVRIALETMSGKGSEVGKTFQELKYIMSKIEKKERIGVCWDTCHLYSAGYDIKNNLEAVISEFEEKIGLNKLWVIHINDSVASLGERKDRHENIGYGKIGWKALQKIVWHPKFNGIVKLLETPREREDYKEEIRKLKAINY